MTFGLDKVKSYPRIRVEGSPRERGRQYGEQARERVQRSVRAYAEVFGYYSGWRCGKVREAAKRFEGSLKRFRPRYLEEIGGIAQGAGVDQADVLAINVRSELLTEARVDAGVSSRGLSECSSFAALAEASGGVTLLGQNWDWLETTSDTSVVLEAHQDEGPSFVTVVEAGLLAKIGFNSSGSGVCTNSLLADGDSRAPGIPYHAMLRALLDSETIGDALETVQRATRASSANYLLADEDGAALDIEAAAGGSGRVSILARRASAHQPFHLHRARRR